MVNRLLNRAELSVTSGAHMGMSLPAYTNCTSPLRKYLDFLTHLQIKSALHGAEPTLVTPEILEALAQRIATCRAATLEAERWLAARYLDRLNAAGPLQLDARIVHINSSGFNVRLEDYGLEGFVDLRKDPEKFSYDKWTASLTSTTRRFQLEQAVQLTYAGKDPASQYMARFELVEGCGLKPPKEEAAPADKTA
jgi:ribonuclease R